MVNGKKNFSCKKIFIKKADFDDKLHFNRRFRLYLRSSYILLEPTENIPKQSTPKEMCSRDMPKVQNLVEGVKWLPLESRVYSP